MVRQQSFESYWNGITKDPTYQEAFSALQTIGAGTPANPMGLDRHTIIHSRRAAITSGLISYEAGDHIPEQAATELACAGLLHDIGKTYCLGMIASGKHLDFNDPYVYYNIRRHPHDGRELAKRIWPEQFATHQKIGMLILGHHSQFNDESRNHPDERILNIYKKANEISQYLIQHNIIYGPVLAHADVMSVISHPKERPYLEASLVDKFPDYMLDPLQVATSIAQKDLKPVQWGITPDIIADLLTEHHDTVEQYALAN